MQSGRVPRVVVEKLGVPERLAFVERLQSTIGIRKNLRSLGVIESTLPAMAHKSFQIKRLMELNPRRPSEADLLAILQAAY